MNLFTKYTSMRFRKLIKLLDRYFINPDTDILHKIRIELKKIKALIHLLDYCFPKFSVSKSYHPLRKIFRDAGGIREVTVLKRLLGKYNIKFRNENESPVNEDLIFDFRKNIPLHKKIAVRSHEAILKHTDKLNRNCYKEYLELKKKQLITLMYPEFSESELHKNRKITKEIIYLSSIVPGTRGNPDTFYKEIEDLIGSWHDKQMLLKLLSERHSRLQKADAESLKSKCSADLQKIKRLVRDFHDREYQF